MFNLKSRNMKTLIAFLAVVFSNCLNAQENNGILYHDFVPDTVVSYQRIITGLSGSSDTLRIDFNNDGTPDMAFWIHRPPSSFNFWCYTASINAGWEYRTVDSTDTISNPNFTWGTGPWFWHHDSKKTMAVRYTDGSDYYYGWFYRHYTLTADSIYFGVDKMAFCTIANYPLVWGQTEISSGVQLLTISEDGLSITIDDGTGNIRIESHKPVKHALISDIKGRQLQSKKNIRSSNVSIGTSNIPKGAYLLSIEFMDGTIRTEKFIR